MRVVERQFSEFLRQPKEVVAAVALARPLRNLAVHRPDALSDAVNEALPWTTFLPPGDQRAIVDELTRTLAASATLENFAPVVQLLREWRATVEIHADPKLAQRLRKPIVGEGRAVPLPQG